MIRYLKLLLWPFSVLYGGIMVLRNFCYNQGILPSQRFHLPVIAVGNLTVGGTGKTPHVEYLLRLLQGQYRVATLSRGYKRNSKGFVLADEHATAALLGDEPFQYYQDFKEVAVAVCEERVAGINMLTAMLPNLGLVILDDAMQHRAVSPSLNILITDFNRPFYTDYVMPAGLLREPRRGAERADAIIVSKCPENLTPEQQLSIQNKIKKYSSRQTPVYFTGYTYGTPVPMGAAAIISKKIILITGIANTVPLQQYLLQAGYQVVQHFSYGDHHQYTPGDIAKLKQQAEQYSYHGISIITTRKDAVKLLSAELIGIIKQLTIFYIPIEVRFLDKGAAFDRSVLEHVQAQQNAAISSTNTR